MVNVPVHQRALAPLTPVSKDFVEQAVDAPVPCVAPGFARDQQLGRSPSRPAVAWLEAPQELFLMFFFSYFSPHQKKSAKVASQSIAELGAHPSSSTSSPNARTTWVDDNGPWCPQRTANIG